MILAELIILVPKMVSRNNLQLFCIHTAKEYFTLKENEIRMGEPVRPYEHLMNKTYYLLEMYNSITICETIVFDKMVEPRGFLYTIGLTNLWQKLFDDSVSFFASYMPTMLSQLSDLFNKKNHFFVRFLFMFFCHLG